MKHDIINEIQSVPLSKFGESKILFHAKMDVEAHAIKKNGKSIRFNRKTGRNFIASNKRSEALEASLVSRLRDQRDHAGIIEPLEVDVQALFIFTFDNFFIKSGKRRSKNIPDLDNLFAAPLDALEKAGVIANDTQVCSFDLSRRMPGVVNSLEIFLLEFKESETFPHNT